MTYRKITANYPGRCAKCREPFYKGDAIYWQRGSREIFHSACYGTPTVQPEPEIEIKPSAPVAPIKGKPDDSGFLTLSDVKAEMLRCLDGNTTLTRQTSSNRSAWGIDEMLTHPDAKRKQWLGWTPEQLRVWLREGFKTEAFENLHSISPPLRKRRRIEFADEGEMQIDLVMGGFDQPFTRWTKRESVPGLAIDVQLTFSASVNEQVIREYLAWILKTCYTLEAEGIDLEVNVFNANRELIHGYDGDIMTRVNIKREQESTDFAKWSVMFSPAGLRGMMFLARCMQADKWGTYVRYHQGYPIADGWGITWDPDTRKVTVTCDSRGRNFPTDEMDAKLKAIVQNFQTN